MNVLVTGANGHIGSQVVRAALAAGLTPIACVREGSDRRALAGLKLETRHADLLDAASVERAVAGVDAVIHVAAVHRNYAADPAAITRPAIDGTRHVLAAMQRHGVKRLVYTSSGATVGFARDPDQPLDEGHFLKDPKSAYIRGKVEAERLVLEAARAPGAPEVVVLNPSGVFGPGDFRLTPATRAIVGMLQGDPAFFAVSFTDVRDVAAAHILALQKGTPGSRYLITGDCLRPKEIADLFFDVAGIRPPTFRPPTFVMKILGALATRKARKDGSDAPFDPDSLADLAGGHLAYDATRSRTALGMHYRPARAVLTDAVRWLLYVDALKPAVAAKVRARLGAAAAPDADWPA